MESGERFGHFCLASGPSPSRCCASRGSQILPRESPALSSLGVLLPRRHSRRQHLFRTPISFTHPPRRAGVQSSNSCGLPGDPSEPSSSNPLRNAGYLSRFSFSPAIIDPSRTRSSRTVLPGFRLGLPGSALDRRRRAVGHLGLARYGPHSSPFSSLGSSGDPFGGRYPYPTASSN